MSAYLSDQHPLASAARRLCTEHGTRGGGLVGKVACGRCWETAIRADERAVLLFDLPPDPPRPDPAHLDPVAIERALRGDDVRLTRAERAEIAHLVATGQAPWSAVQHIGLSGSAVTKARARRRHETVPAA